MHYLLTYRLAADTQTFTSAAATCTPRNLSTDRTTIVKLQCDNWRTMGGGRFCPTGIAAVILLLRAPLISFRGTR